MKSSDKFLIGIVAGIVLLIVVAFVITLTQPEGTYQAEDTAGGVVHNYLLALQQQDYERARRYLSPTLPGYPGTISEFSRNVQSNSWRFHLDSDYTLAVEETIVTGKRATVTVRESRFDGGDLFDSAGYSTTFKMQLSREEGEWKIVDSPYYFARCWAQSDGCP